VPNFAGALKGEMRRLARKEVRATVTPLRKVVAALRRRVAQQKRLIAELERSTKRSMRNGRAAEAPETQDSQHEPPRVREAGRCVRSDDLRLGDGASEAAAWRAGNLAAHPVHGEA